MKPSAARSPVPESRSSGREYPVKPSLMASRDKTVPMTQLISRGLRNAPVKKTRNMCTVIETVKSSAAQ